MSMLTFTSYSLFRQFGDMLHTTKIDPTTPNHYHTPIIVLLIVDIRYHHSNVGSVLNVGIW